MPNNYPQPTVYLQSGDPNTCIQDNLYPGQLGSRFAIIDPDGATLPPGAKIYQLVKLDSNAMTTLPFAGAVAWWVSRTNYTVSTSISTAGGRGKVAGVFLTAVTAAQVAAQKVVCIQIAGHANVTYVDSPTATPDATGLFVIPSATDGKADCLAAGTAATYPKLGESAGAATNHVGIVNLTVGDTNP